MGSYLISENLCLMIDLGSVVLKAVLVLVVIFVRYYALKKACELRCHTGYLQSRTMSKADIKYLFILTGSLSWTWRTRSPI